MFPAAQSFLRRIFLLFLLSSGSVTVAFAGDDRWISIGPSGGGILALAVDPSNHSVVYAGTGGGVFKSTSGGANWTAINNGIRVRSNVISARAIAIDPTNTNVVYAGVVNNIFKSTNGGFSWTEIKAGNGEVRILVVDAGDSNTIYAGLSDVGILRSTDGGATWTSINTSLKRTLDIKIDPSDRKTIYATAHDGIHKSANNGVTWNPVNEGLTQMRVHTIRVSMPLRLIGRTPGQSMPGILARESSRVLTAGLAGTLSTRGWPVDVSMLWRSILLTAGSSTPVLIAAYPRV